MDLSSASARWAKQNPELNSYQSAKRKAHILRATPAWADLEAIELFCLSKPEGMEVDHIVPLRGKKVCGLHIIDNLQYLNRSQNASKNNRFDEWS